MKWFVNILVLTSILCCFSKHKAYGQSLYDFPDVHVFPSGNPQSEVHISVNPNNPGNLIIGCNTYPGYPTDGSILLFHLAVWLFKRASV